MTYSEEYYLTEPGAAERFCAASGLSLDELLLIVGRFRKNHHRFAGQIRGLARVHYNGTLELVHHFSKKVLWCA